MLNNKRNNIVQTFFLGWVLIDSSMTKILIANIYIIFRISVYIYKIS